MVGGVIELTGEMRAGAAADLKVRLQAALEAGDLRVAADGLTAVDCATVQVLVAAGRTAARLDRNLQIDAAGTGTLGTMLERLGIHLPDLGAATTGH